MYIMQCRTSACSLSLSLSPLSLSCLSHSLAHTHTQRRDGKHVNVDVNQIDFMVKCMQQDCAQSMEGGNANQKDNLGCRFLDPNGFCYIYGTWKNCFIWAISMVYLYISTINLYGKNWFISAISMIYNVYGLRYIFAISLLMAYAHVP